MNHRTSLLSLLTIPSLLLFTPHITIASTIPKTEVVEGKVDQALQLAESLEIPYYDSSKAHLLRDIVINFAKLGEFERALEITQSIHESFRWNPSGNIAIELAAAGKIEQSLGQMKQAIYLSKLPSANSLGLYQDGLLSLIVGKLAEKGHVEEALALSQNPKYISSQAIMLEGIAGGLGARREFERGLEIAASIEDNYFKASALVRIIFQLIEAKKFAQGMEVVESLSKPANGFGYQGANLRNIAITFAEAEQFDFALKVAKILNLPTEDQDDNELSSEFHNIALQKIAIYQAQAGNIDEALEMAKSFSREDKVYILNEVAIALVKSGETNRALELARSLEEHQQVWVLGDIATTLVEQGEIDKALQLIKSLTNPSRTTIAKFAIKLAEVGKIDLALEFAQSVADSNKDLILAHVAAAFVEQGDFAKAKEIRQSIDDKQIFALERTITELAEQGKLTTAKQLSQLLPNNLAKAGVLNKLATYHIEAGEKEQATKLLNEALSIIKNI